MNFIYRNGGKCKDSVMILLEIAHEKKWLGLSGIMLGWLKSYLEMEYVNGCGVLQGSALGPLLVNVYMLLNVQFRKKKAQNYMLFYFQLAVLMA